MEPIRIFSIHPSHKEFEPWTKFNKKIVVRFGSVGPVDGDIILQDPSAIIRCSDKWTMKNLFRLSGIPSPEFGRIPWNGCVMKRLNHSRCKGMKRISVAKRTRPARKHYYEAYHECKTELRVHVFNDRVFFVDEKVLREDGCENWMRSNKHGYVFEWRKIKDQPEKMLNDCIKAVKCLGLLFGACDVGIKHDGSYIIFEVNSAPGLRTRTRRRYQRQITRYIKENYDVEWEDPE